MTRFWLVLIFAVAWAPVAVHAQDLESLDPDTALGEISSSEGLVFVDLYADW